MRLLFLIAAGYAVICLFVFLRQRQMMYFPGKETEETMTALAKGCGYARWLTKDGKPIGWLRASGPGGPPVLILHGNGGNALDRVGLAERLRSYGIAARFYILDYPGYGSREGRPDQTSLTAAAVEALKQFDESVVLIGESLGTGVAAQAAACVPEKVRGVILLTPFDSMAAAAAHHYPWLPVPLLVLDRWDSIAALSSFDKPVAVILAGDDATTPVKGGQRLFNSLKGPKRLWVVAGAGHNDVEDGLGSDDWLAAWRLVSTGRN